MIKRIMSLFNKSTTNINEAAFLLGGFTLVSQLLGLVRDRLLATYVGAGLELDVYYAAFKIPDLLFTSVATLAALTVLLPQLSLKYKDGDVTGKQNAKVFLDQIFTVLIIFLVVISGIVFIFLPRLVPLIVPGFPAEAQSMVVMVSRIMLIQPIIIGISNLFSSITQMFGKFFITALTPVVYNVGIILGVTFFYPIWGVVGLAYGVILGAIFHIGIQIPLLIRSGLVPSITHVIVWSEIKAMVKTSIPRTLALSLSSFTLIILTAIASRMSSGSISIFTLTNNILNVPIAIIGISYSVASFPTLIKLYQNSNYKDFVDHILYATKKIIFWAVPVLVLFVILRAQIIRVILGTQSFSWNDTRLAAASLAIFVVGVVSQSLIHLFVRSYYAAGNTRRPLITAIISQLVIISSAFAFLSLFRTNEVFTDIVRNVLRLEGIITLDLLALPMAFVLGNITNGFLLFYFLNKDFSIRQYRQLCVTSVQTIIASIGMGLTTYALLNILAPVINQQVFLGILGQGILAGLGGMLVFGSILLMMKNQDIIDLLKIMKGKFWKKDIVIMEQIEIDQ